MVTAQNPEPQTNTPPGYDRKKEVLSAAQKLAIREYVGQFVSAWATWLLVANLLVLGASVTYIFFILPAKASLKSQAIVEEQIAKETASLQKQLAALQEDSIKVRIQFSERANEADTLRERSRLLEEALNKLQAQQVAISNNLASAEKANPVEAGKFVAELEKNGGDPKKLLAHLADLQNRLEKLDADALRVSKAYFVRPIVGEFNVGVSGGKFNAGTYIDIGPRVNTEGQKFKLEPR